MDHFIDVDVYRPQDWRKRYSAAGCNQGDRSPDSPFFAVNFLGLRTQKKSTVNAMEQSPYSLSKDNADNIYERKALKKAEPGVPRPR
jgi:hypothetical protein